MSKFKKRQVVMLPTEKASNIQLNGGLHYHKNPIRVSRGTNQDLYILSDDEIKEGDWYFDTKKKDIRQWKLKNHDSYIGKKVIATTDESLGLPQPSQSFLKKYVEEYNKGNVITDVLVEYEIDYVANATPPTKPLDPTVYMLKVNPKDNTITIKKVKDSWSREELEEKLKALRKECIEAHNKGLSPDTVGIAQFMN